MGVNSKCRVQSKRRCESHESCVCIVGFLACGCQKKSVVYKTECRHAAVQRGNSSSSVVALRPRKRDGLLGTGTEWEGDKTEWRLDRGYRPKKTGENVDRRQNNGSVSGVPSSLPSDLCTAQLLFQMLCLDRVTKTMSFARYCCWRTTWTTRSKRSRPTQFRSPAPAPYSWSLLG